MIQPKRVYLGDAREQRQSRSLGGAQKEVLRRAAWVFPWGYRYAEKPPEGTAVPKPAGDLGEALRGGPKRTGVKELHELGMRLSRTFSGCYSWTLDGNTY